MPYKPESIPQSIEDVGVKEYLNNTKATHNGLGYNEFVQMLEIGLPKTKIAENFKVGRPTLYRWISAYEKST